MAVEVAFGDPDIVWADAIGNPDILGPGSLPEGIPIRRIKDYKEWEYLAIHEHILRNQEIPSSRFTWIPAARVKAQVSLLPLSRIILQTCNLRSGPLRGDA